jgi:hypothetical protein
LRTLTFLILLSSVASCSAPELIREVTYPPSFRYIDQQEVNGAMYLIAQHVVKLERTLSETMLVAGNVSHSEGILRELRAIESQAAKLNHAEATNHPLLDKNLSRFLDTVREAIDAAEQEPPQFLPATRVSAACGYCH